VSLGRFRQNEVATIFGIISPLLSTGVFIFLPERGCPKVGRIYKNISIPLRKEI
jgi:hypothetical protein